MIDRSGDAEANRESTEMLQRQQGECSGVAESVSETRIACQTLSSFTKNNGVRSMHPDVQASMNLIHTDLKLKVHLLY